MTTAISIKTDLWNKAIEILLQNQWVCTYKYDNFDAGIDFDFIILVKDNEEILLGWTNWFEGEIQCSDSRMREIENSLSTKFKKGTPESLKPETVHLLRNWETGAFYKSNWFVRTFKSIFNAIKY